MGNCTSCLRSQERAKSQHSAAVMKSYTHTSENICVNTQPSVEPHKAPSSHRFQASQRKIAPMKGHLVTALIKDALTATVIARPKTLAEKSFIKKSLKIHSVFNKLPKATRHFVVDEMHHYALGAQETIFSQGDPGNNFFIVFSGAVEVIVNGALKAQIASGGSFGELALMYDSLRTATIRTLQPTELWGIDQKTFRDAVKSINAKEYNESRDFIQNVPLFSLLNAEQREALLAVLVRMDFRIGQVIVNEGDPGDIFYVIQMGTVSCSNGKKEIRQMGKGEFFGEQALLYNTQRTATVTAITEVAVLSLGREHLNAVLGDSLSQILYRNSQRMTLERVPELRSFTKSQIDRIAESMHIYQYSAGDCVISRGSPIGNILWVILNGLLRTSETNEEYKIHDFIGSEIFRDKILGSYSENYIAHIDSCVARISKFELESCFGDTLNHVASKNELISAIQAVNLFKCLPKQKLEQLSKVLGSCYYTESTVIFNEGELSDSFYIVKEGKVDIMKNGIWIRSIGKYDYFGERAILLNEARTASVIASEGTVCWVLTKPDFLRLVEEGIRTQLLQRMELQDDKVQIADLDLISSIGKGMFGNVYLATHKQTQVNYALKTVSRMKITAYGLYNCLVLERSILLQLDHPFIVKLVKTLKDDQRIYFLMEYVRGMDLFDVIRKLNLVSDRDAKFYTGSLLLILEHLHEKNIVYRDLKPENIMVDHEGYLKMIDFGSAKILSERTYTITGTPHYMAPEVIMGKGYRASADLWSLGVMLFEFVCGCVPFGEEEEDPYLIYERILEYKLVFPRATLLSVQARLLIEQLMNFNAVMRGNYSTVKEHFWFKEMDWDTLLSKQGKTPYVPVLRANAMENFCFEEVILRDEEQDLLELPSDVYEEEVLGWDEDF